MPKIIILPDDIKNKIAAGEVVERPASALKELLENSIDAGATEMVIDVANGGKRLIRLIDNGTGMEHEDAILAFKRHATSKLKSIDDLFRIKTLGFRGEALPSIASVSKVSITTGISESSPGTSIEIMAGEIKEIKDSSPIKGTSIEVRDLFYNVPARRKFLKSTQTELRHIIETVMQRAIPYPELSITLKHDGRSILELSRAGDIKERLLQLYGREFINGLIELSKDDIYCLASTSDFTMHGRDYQYLFVNRRPVKNPSINHAVYRAYEGLIPKDRHPVYFIFMEIDPHRVDVNIHPAKREIKFEDGDILYNTVYSLLEEGAGRSQTTPFDVRTNFHSIAQHQPIAKDEADAVYHKLEMQDKPLFLREDIPLYEEGRGYLYLGDAFTAYINDDGLTIIDQHAAHERVLFEGLLEKGIDSERLLIPARVQLTPQEFGVLMKNNDAMLELGFEFSDFGGNSILISSIPSSLKGVNLTGLLHDIASMFIEGPSAEKSLRERLAARIACSNAVKSGELLSRDKLDFLIDDLNKTRQPYKCPHGRPTRIHLSLNDLRRLFKRQ